MRKIWVGIFLLFACCAAGYAQPFADIVTDYGRPTPILRNGAPAKSFLFNIGADIYKVQKDKPLGVLMGARVGAMKNDGQFVKDATQQLWGTKIQMGFVAGMQATRIRNNKALMAAVVAGPMHMANIEIGRFDQPMTAVVTEAAVYAEVISGVYFGAKYVYYAIFFDHRLQQLPFSSQPVIALSMRVGI